MSLISVGAALPLGYQLHDGATGKFVRAHVRDQANAAVTGSPFALTHVAQGFYSNTAYTVLLANTKLKATFIVFDDAGFTIESVFHTRGSAETDVETRVEVARTDVLTRLGTPAGASVSVDIAAIKADSGTLITRLTAGRATNLDNLDATVGSRSTQTSVNNIQTDTDDIQLKIGTPVVTLASDIAGVQTTANAINTKLGTPVGATVSVDIAAVQTTANALNTKLGTPAGATVSADIAAVKADTATLTSRLTSGRATNLDNLDVLLSTRATQTSVDNVQADTDDIQAKIGIPVATLATDIAGVQTTANTINTKIGTPVGASVSADIAAVQADTDDIQVKLGTPVGASISVDIAAVQTTATAIDTKLGTPVGASVSADIAAVKSDTATLTSRLTSGRASNLDNLDVLLSTRATQTSVNDVQADTDDIQTKIGIPVATLATDIAGVQTTANAINTKLGTPTGATVSADIAAVQADTDDIQTKIGTPVGASVSVDIAAVQTTANAINTKLGTPAGASVSADIAAVKSDTATLTSRLTSGRASNLDNLDVLLSTRATQTSVNDVQADTDDIQTKIGTPVGASISIDIAAVQTTATAINTKLGTPAGASVSADIAAVKSDTATLTSRLTSGRASNLDNLNATISSRSTQTSVDAVQTDTDDIQAKIGTPVATLATDIAGVQTTANAVNTKLGTPAGASVSADIAAIYSRIGVPAGASVSADIAAVKTQLNSIETKVDDLSSASDSALSIPSTFLVPTSGSNTFRIYWRHFAAGVPDDPFSGPTIIIERSDGSDIVASTAMTAESTGVFYYDYVIPDTADNGIQVIVKVSYVNDSGGPTFQAIATANQTSSASAIDDILTILGTPAGASVSADIAALQTTANTINTKIGTPAGASVSADIAAVYSRIGAPAGASVSADIAAVKSDTATLTSRLTSGRASNLDNLDVLLSTRATQTSVNDVQADTDDIQAKIGVPVTSISADIAAVQADTNDIQAKIGTPVGASVSADIAAVKSDTTTLTSRLTSGRATNLDNLNATVSSRATQTSVDNVQADTDDIQTKIGTPVGASIAIDIAGVQTTASAVNTKLGTPAGASVSADIAAVQADTDDIQTKIGTPVGASVSADIAAVQTTANAINTKLGTPAGASVSADIAAVKSDSGTLVARLTATRASNLDFLDVLLSTRATQTSVNNAQTDIDALEIVIAGIATDTSTLILRLTAGRATNLDFLDVLLSTRATQTSVNSLQTTANTINTKLGTPVGASVSADIAAVKSDTAAILDDTGTSGVLVASAEKDSIVDRVWDELQSGHTTAGTFGKRLDADTTTRESESSALSRFNDLTSDIAAVQADTDDIQMKIGTPAGASVSADIAAVEANVVAIRNQTDLISFDGGNRVNVHVILNDDKSNYALSAGGRASVADDIWDELLIGHLIPGSSGSALNNVSGFSLAGVAAAVWDEQALSHIIAGSFGEYMGVIRQSGLATIGHLTNGGYGLFALSALISNSELTVIAAIVAQNPNIAAIIPAISASQVVLKAEIDQNQILLEGLANQLTATEADIIAEIDIVSGKVDAVSGQVSAIQNNTTVRFIVPERISKPVSGNKTYQIHLRLYDDVGFPEAPDSIPTLRMRRLDTAVDVLLDVAMTQDGVKVGAYYYDLIISAGSDIYPALVEATVVENGATRYVPAVTEITEFDSDLDAIQAQLTAVQNTVDATQLSVDSGVYGLAALKTSQNAIVVEVNQNETLINAVKAKTDTIPVDPATLSSVAAVNATVLTRPDIGAIQTRLDLLRDAIRGTANRTNTEVFDKIDFTGVMQTSDPRLNFLDAAVSSRSTLDAATVWAYSTRTLTASSLSAASIQAIWDYLTSAATAPGSFGLRIGTNLDATVSSRATAAQVTSLLVGVAQEASLGVLSTLVSTEANENEIKLNALQADVTLIKNKTTNLPSDPSSASAMSAGFNANTIAVANMALNVTGIKTKTDNLPVDPATESSVLARPTNPVLTSDIRLNRLDVNVSTRSVLTAGDLALLATTAQLNAGNVALTTEINANQVDIAAVQTTANLIKAKTDQLVYTSGRVDAVISGAQEDSIVDKVWDELNASHVAVGSTGESLNDAAGGASPTVIAAAVWDEATAGHVAAGSFGKLVEDTKADTGTINTKLGTPVGVSVSADIAAITESHRTCRMSTTLTAAGTAQEVIVWAEEAGERITVSSACTITIKTATGATVWTATLASPNTDGVFRFTNAFVAVADVNYYILMSITVAGQPIVTQQAFITVG